MRHVHVRIYIRAYIYHPLLIACPVQKFRMREEAVQELGLAAAAAEV